ncbi:MAG: hypothetical protein AAF802_17125, partial [Planctomycetota bacterium]
HHGGETRLHELQRGQNHRGESRVPVVRKGQEMTSEIDSRDEQRYIRTLLIENTTGARGLPGPRNAPSPNLSKQELPMSDFPSPAAEAAGLIFCAPSRGPPFGRIGQI